MDEAPALREFIREYTVRTDRFQRQLFAEMRDVVERNTRAFERFERSFARMEAELDDHRDERRAVVDALMRLIDRIDRMDPGGASA